MSPTRGGRSAPAGAPSSIGRDTQESPGGNGLKVPPATNRRCAGAVQASKTIGRRGRAEVVWPSKAPKGGQTASGPRPQPPTRAFAAPFPASRVAVTEMPSVSGRRRSLPRSSRQPAANQRGSWPHVIWICCTPHLPSRAPVPERMGSRVLAGLKVWNGVWWPAEIPASQHPSRASLPPSKVLDFFTTACPAAPSTPC